MPAILRDGHRTDGSSCRPTSDMYRTGETFIVVGPPPRERSGDEPRRRGPGAEDEGHTGHASGPDVGEVAPPGAPLHRVEPAIAAPGRHPRHRRVLREPFPGGPRCARCPRAPGRLRDELFDAHVPERDGRAREDPPGPAGYDARP